jgi:hypothetical protein
MNQRDCARKGGAGACYCPDCGATDQDNPVDCTCVPRTTRPKPAQLVAQPPLVDTPVCCVCGYRLGPDEENPCDRCEEREQRRIGRSRRGEWR